MASGTTHLIRLDDPSQEPNEKLEDSHQMIDSLDRLSDITIDRLNMVVCQREVDPNIRNYLTTIHLDDWQDLEMVLNKDDLADVEHFEHLLPESPHLNGRQALTKDIKSVTQAYFDIGNESLAKVSLSMIEVDMCRIFHVDQLSLRLLCTYHGLGTEWLEESNATRGGLGKGCNSRIVKNMDLVRRLSPFDVAVLKGESYARGQKKGVIHRSPPVEGTENPWRILLKIDAAHFG